MPARRRLIAACCPQRRRPRRKQSDIGNGLSEVVNSILPGHSSFHHFPVLFVVEGWYSRIVIFGTAYMLRPGRSRVRIPVTAIYFFNIQSGSGAQQASCSAGTGVLYRG
jgi:hypothetical protein